MSEQVAEASRGLAKELVTALKAARQSKEEAKDEARRQREIWGGAIQEWKGEVESQLVLHRAADESLMRTAVKLAHLTQRQETASEPWVWDWSRRELRLMLLMVMVGVGLGVGGYSEIGPVKELRQENAKLRQEVADYKRLWWKKATEEQRAQILSQEARPEE